MTATGTLQRPSSAATFDEATGRSTYPAPTVLWTSVPPDPGIRVQRLSRRAIGRGDQVGGRTVEVQMYQVSIPVAAPEPQINDQIVITANPDDPYLVGKTLRVVEVRLGSLLWQRDMTCEEITPTTR